MSWIWENAEKIGTLCTAAAAILALIYAHLQISEGRKAERQANAHELWRDYLRLAFDNPKFADPGFNLAKFDYEDLTIDGSRELFQKYEWFIDAVLDACEEILEVLPSKEWQATVRIQLRLHRDYLQSPYFLNSGYLVQYTPKFRAFMEEVLKGTEPPLPASPSIAWMDVPNQRAKKRAKAHHR